MKLEIPSYLSKQFIAGVEIPLYGRPEDEVQIKYGTKVAATDLAILLGCQTTQKNERTIEEDLSCLVWTCSSTDDGYVMCIKPSGERTWWEWEGLLPHDDRAGIRPILVPEANDNNHILAIPSDKVAPASIAGLEVREYGEYPQTVADKKTSKKLEDLLKKGELNLTGKKYTFDGVSHKASDRKEGWVSAPFKQCPEYIHEGKKYIRLNGNPCRVGTSKLSNGEKAQFEKVYWVQVEPIEWLKDSSGYWISKKCLLSGINFNGGDYDDDFEDTDLKKFLDAFFIKEIEPTSEKHKTKVRGRRKQESKLQSVLQSKTLTAIKETMSNLVSRFKSGGKDI